MVVVGAGFGGLQAVRKLAKLPVNVLLIDRHNYHLFQPLLYQVATAGLEPEEIAHPVRGILRGLSNVRFLVTEVERIDLATRTLFTEAGTLPYDYLVLAAGSTTNFFGMESVARAAKGLKDVDEAMSLRNHILTQFEAAAWEPDAEQSPRAAHVCRRRRRTDRRRVRGSLYMSSSAWCCHGTTRGSTSLRCG